MTISGPPPFDPSRSSTPEPAPTSQPPLPPQTVAPTEQVAAPSQPSAPTTSPGVATEGSEAASSTFPRWLPKVLVGLVAVVVIGGLASTLFGGTGALLLLVEDDDRPEYHLVEAGQEPSNETEIDLPENFDPSSSPYGDRGFTENGSWLVGTGFDNGEQVLVVVDTSSGERTDVLESDDFLSTRILGNRVIVGEPRGSSTDYFIFDPSSPNDLTDIGSGTSYFTSRDERFVAISDDGDLVVVEVDGANEVLDVESFLTAFAPDGGHIAVVGEDTVAIHELPSGDLVVEADVDSGFSTGITWNGGDALVFNDFEAEELLMLTTDGQTVPLGRYVDFKFIAPDSRDLVLFDDGEALYFSSATGDVTDLDNDGYFHRVNDAESGQRVELVYVDETEVFRIAADGIREIVDASSGLFLEQSVALDGVTYLLFVGEGEVELFAVGGDAGTEIFSGDGDFASLYEVDGRLFLETYEGDATVFAVASDGVAELERADGFGIFQIVGSDVYLTTVSSGRDVVRVGLDGEGGERYARDYRLLAGFSD